MKTYLAEVGLEYHLAWLPEHAELRGRKSHEVCGVLRKEDRDVFASPKEPAHKVFVNWLPTPEGVLAFTKLYGLLDPTGKYYQSPLLLDRTDKDKTFSFKVETWVEWQQYFREFWDENADVDLWDHHKLAFQFELMTGETEEHPDRLGEPAPPARPRLVIRPGLEVTNVKRRGGKPFFELTATTLWQYLCALLVFHKAGDLRKCQNPDCPAPRFIARRKDQIFCTGDCAGLVANRRWWAKHGKQWRRRRMQKKLRGGKH